MTTAQICQQCGRTLPDGTPDALCPYCLLSPEEDRSATVTMESRFQTPSIDEVQAHFDPDRFRIERLLGSGGMGAVYLARQPHLGRDVAIKILPVELADTPGFDERFAREAQVLARLDHPNVVDVYDYGKSGPFSYLMLEYVDGVNLRQLMHEQQLTPADALEIVPQLCDALQFAHDQGIIHRDIKPENILLDTRGRVKVTDFGLAKIIQSRQRVGNLTQSNQVLGTPSYMAPEQIETPNQVDHRADIYALGVVFYELLTGELPLGRFSPPGVKSGSNRRLDKVVMRTLEKDPNRRYEKASTVKSDVEKAASTGNASNRAAQQAADFVSDSAAAAKRSFESFPFDRLYPRDRSALLSAIAIAAFYLFAISAIFALGHSIVAVALFTLLTILAAMSVQKFAAHAWGPRWIARLSVPPLFLAERTRSLFGLSQVGTRVPPASSTTETTARATKLDPLEATRQVMPYAIPALTLIAGLCVLIAIEGSGIFAFWALVLIAFAWVGSRVYLRYFPKRSIDRLHRWILFPPIIAGLIVIGCIILIGPVAAGGIAMAESGRDIEDVLRDRGSPYPDLATGAIIIGGTVTLLFAWMGLLAIGTRMFARPVVWLARPFLDDWQGRGMFLTASICIAISVLAGSITWLVAFA